jgi:long-chain fatty acid transport protein
MIESTTTRTDSAGLGWFALAASLGTLTPPALAGSFYLPASDGVVNLGRASAGRSAVGFDATSVFSNPAALTQLEGTRQWTVGLTPLYIDNVIHDRGTTVLDGIVPGGVPAQGTDSANGSAFNALPTLAWARRIGGERNIWIGAGAQTPYGLGLTYDGPEKFRYDTDEVRLKVIDASAVIGFKLADTLSLGGGINVQYTNAHLISAVPNLSGTAVPGLASTDGHLNIRGDNTDVGFNVGLHFRPAQDWQFGLHYRSSIDNNVEGTLKGKNLTGPLAGLNQTFPMSVAIKYPGSLAAAAAWQTSDALQLLAEVRWFEWSRFDELRFKLSGGPELVRPENYRDAWSGAIGAEYRLDPARTFRAGYMFEQTPTTGTTRSVAVPDANRHLFSVGTSWAFKPGWAADVAYQFIKWETVDINRPDPNTPSLATTRATGNPTAHFLGIALRRIY